MAQRTICWKTTEIFSILLFLLKQCLFLYTFALFYYLYFTAVLIVFVAFFIYKKVRTPETTRLWRFIEMAIDSYRYFLLNDLIYWYRFEYWLYTIFHFYFQKNLALWKKIMLSTNFVAVQLLELFKLIKH